MPELPDITVYLECLEPKVLGEVLSRLLKSDWPRTLEELEGRK